MCAGVAVTAEYWVASALHLAALLALLIYFITMAAKSSTQRPG